MVNSPAFLIFSILLLGISIRLWIVRRRHNKAHELLSKTRDKLSVAEDTALKLRELTSALEKTLNEQKEQQAVIEEHRAKMLQSAKLSALGEMAGGVAHEINSPLTVISLSVDHLRDLVQDEKLDKEAVERALDRIENTTFRIARIIKSLKTFCSDGSAQPTTDIPVRELIDDTLSFCSQRFSTGSVDLRVGELPQLVLPCRPVELSQVLLNLLNNAYDAVMSEGDRWIQLAVEDKGDMVEISVTDSGPGIPVGVRDRIMQPFFTTKQPGHGTGLGLSISRGIAESHGGELFLDENSKRTRFVLRLPKQAPANITHAA